jgi:hypothetical protein
VFGNKIIEEAIERYIKRNAGYLHLQRSLGGTAKFDLMTQLKRCYAAATKNVILVWNDGVGMLFVDFRAPKLLWISLWMKFVKPIQAPRQQGIFLTL